MKSKHELVLQQQWGSEGRCSTIQEDDSGSPKRPFIAKVLVRCSNPWSHMKSGLIVGSPRSRRRWSHVWPGQEWRERSWHPVFLGISRAEIADRWVSPTLS